MTATATREAAAAPAAAPEKKSLLKSKKAILALVALAGIGGGAYMMLQPTPKEPIAGGDIVPLDATTVNLTDGHYLKVGVAVQLIKGKASTDDFKTSEAAELVIDEFSDRSVKSLSSNGARKKLGDELERKIKKAYDGEVYAIFLTQFVTQ